MLLLGYILKINVNDKATGFVATVKFKQIERVALDFNWWLFLFNLTLFFYFNQSKCCVS